MHVDGGVKLGRTVKLMLGSLSPIFHLTSGLTALRDFHEPRLISDSEV